MSNPKFVLIAIKNSVILSFKNVDISVFVRNVKKKSECVDNAKLKRIKDSNFTPAE